MDDDTGTISPLPAHFRRGQIGLGIIGMLSLLSSSILFLHITYKLVLLWLRSDKDDDDTPRSEVDLSLGLSEEHYKQTKTGTVLTHEQHDPQAAASRSNRDDERRKRPRKQKAPNPLLILIYNLILSDISMSATYSANIYWLKEDTIDINSANCRAQGWLVSFGCVITSAFLLTLATYTYAIVINGWRPSSKSTVIVSLGIWVASILVTCLGPMFSGKETYYARQQFWCWIEGSNAGWRLTVYIPGFFCLCSAFTVYTWTFWCLHKRRQSARMMPRSSSSSAISDGSRGIISTDGRQSSVGTAQLSGPSNKRKVDGTNPGSKNNGKLRPSGHHPAFLIYPIIYTVVASPLTLGSITPLEHNFLFMAIAAAMLAMLGFFNAILWACTIIFSRREDLVDTGLEYFSFMRTPSDREYGNMIWVQGGAARPPVAGEGNPDDEEQGIANGNGGGGKMRWFPFGRARRGSDSEIPLRDQQPSGKNGGIRGGRADSGAESAMGTDGEGVVGRSGGGRGIRMDVSTTVVVEDSRTAVGYGPGGS